MKKKLEADNCSIDFYYFVLIKKNIEKTLETYYCPPPA